MAGSAVESLIAISDTMCPPLAQPTPVGSGNFFGPWLTDDRWSPRKHPPDSTVSPRKKGTPRINQLSKSLPRRLSLYTSANINNSPYGAQRSQTPVEDSVPRRSKLRLTARARTFVASSGSRKHVKIKSLGRKGSKISEKGKRGEEETAEEEGLGWEDEDEDEDSTRVTKPPHFQKPSLPALITLTSNTNDIRSTFALGRQLELPLPKVYVSVAQKHSARTSRASSATSPVTTYNSFPTYPQDQGVMNPLASRGTWQADTNLPISFGNSAARGSSFTYNSNGGGRDVSQCRAEALKKALEMRNPPPPTHSYEDISDHIRHYRIHCTVLGTGRFSLANEREQRDVKPVQWQDLFPHRPLTAATSVVDVPIFRFSVADFRIQTAPSVKGYRSSASPLPRAATPKHLTPEDEASKFGARFAEQTKSHLDEACSDTSTVSDEKFEVKTDEKPTNVTSDSKSGSLQLEERFARASRISSFTVYNDSIQQVTNASSDQRGEDNEYMQYLRSKNSSIRQSGNKQKTSKDSNCNDKVTKDIKLVSIIETQNAGIKQNLDPRGAISEEEEQSESNQPKSKKKNKKEPKLMKGSNFASKKCEGQYGPSIKPQPKHTSSGLISRGRYFSAHSHEDTRLPAPKLVVDAERLRESVEEKIAEGESKFRSSLNEAVMNQILARRGNKRLWQKIGTRDAGVFNASRDKKSASVNQTSDTDAVKALQNMQEQSNGSERENYLDEEDISGKLNDQGDNSRFLTEDDQQDEVEDTAMLPPRKNLGLVTSYDFKGYVEALRAKTERFIGGKDDPDGEDELLGIDSAGRKGSPVSFVAGKKRNWRPKESRIRSAARGGRYRLRYPRKSRTRSRSRDTHSDDAADFPRNSTSARLKYKPTSPATSAFVISAPPNSSTTGVGGRSVVLPLEDFMEMAVEGKDQSFADWKTCLNNSSLSSMSKSQGQRSRSDGLLKVVSFATPVNQFIFAKKITFDSTESLGVFPSSNKKADTLEENRSEPAGKVVQSSRYRLRLSDFGLPGTFQRRGKSKANTELQNQKTPRVSSKNKGDEKIETEEEHDKNLVDTLDEEISNIRELHESIDSVNKDIQDQIEAPTQNRENTLSQIVNDRSARNDTSERVNPVTQDVKWRDESLTEGSIYKSIKESSKPPRGRSVSAEAHACLRKEILRLMGYRKSATASRTGENDLQTAVEGRKNSLTDMDIKGLPGSKLVNEEGKDISPKAEKPVPTSNSSQAPGAFSFRYNRQNSSLSPRRLRLKHTVRRFSERDRSLSPSNVHRYFHRRRSSTEVCQDMDLNVPPLTIQGGGLTRPAPETTKMTSDDTTLKVSCEDRARLSKSFSTVTDQIKDEETESKACGIVLSTRELKPTKDCFLTTASAAQVTEQPQESSDKSESNDVLKKPKILSKKTTKYVRFSVDL